MPIINKKDKDKKVLELTANIVLKNERGIQISETPAKIVLDKENFSIFPENGGTYLFSYREIIDLVPEDYRLKLSLGQGKELQVSQLGYQYEDFVKIFIKLRNEVLLKDLLFQETLKKSGFEADFVYSDKSGVEKQKGKAEFKFYQTSLVILPERGELVRIHFGDIRASKTDDFQVIITDETGQKVIISKLGEKFDFFKEILNGCLNEISLNIQNFIKGIWPEIDFSTLNKISELMKEGKAVKRKDIEIISSEFWQRLEKKITKTEMKEEYEFLQTIGEKDEIYIGFKKGLMGKLTGDYLWFFIPIYPVRSSTKSYSLKAKPPNGSALPEGQSSLETSNGVYGQDKFRFGNAIAFETTGEKETGRATYFFRIVSRKEYAKIKDINAQADDLVIKINRALGAINFRREPIYLSEEKLDEPEYVRYKFSMAKIPEIKLMRELFIGRVVHRDDEQWQKDVKNLLRFNISSKDDKEKWSSVATTVASSFVRQRRTTADKKAVVVQKATEDEQKAEEAAENKTEPRF